MSTTKHRVLLVGNYEPDHQFSMQGYLKGLHAGLVDRGWPADVVRPTARVNRRPLGRLAKWAGYIDKMVLFPRQLAQTASQYDLVHVIDQGNGFYGPVVSKFNHLYTIHDLLAIRVALGELDTWQIGKSGHRLQEMILSGLRACSNFVSISEQTRIDLDNLVPNKKYHRKILNGMIGTFVRRTPTETKAVLTSHGVPPEAPYVFHIGMGPYKNQSGVVKIFGALRSSPSLGDLRLVILSKYLDDDAAAVIAEMGLDQHVHVLSMVPKESVEALYSGAVALLFPSFIEGFGLPIIEAQSCGCPVVTSDREPMREVAGDSAVLVDPADVESGVPAVLARLQNRDEWVAAGTKNTERFTYDRWVSDYESCYCELLR
ncbi:MAG: glycosyltransferase family 4 protein [Fimbriimonadaceae bacterium]|nr:glycosyltransferase family 4 protein [Fimbriimonadaceae bacterium]